MTKPIILIPLSVIVPCDPNKSKQAFAQLGVTTWQFIRHWFTWNSLIRRYRLGGIDHLNFRNELKKIFPVLNSHPDTKIDAAWNIMCEYNEHSTAGFKAIQNLVDTGYEIYIFSRTNPKHIEFITKSFFDADPNFTALPGRYKLSFEEDGKKMSHDFVRCLRDQIRKQNASAMIQLFYSQPTNPAPGFIGWFQKPYEKFIFNAAEKCIKELQLSYKTLGIELISSEQSHIASTLSDKINPAEEKRDDLGALLNTTAAATEMAMPLDSHPVITFRGKEADKEAAKQKAKEGEENKVEQQPKFRTFRPRFCPLAAD